MDVVKHFLQKGLWGAGTALCPSNRHTKVIHYPIHTLIVYFPNSLSSLDERQALHSIMKDLVALQMTRRQPVLSYDSNKPKIPAQANRQVRYNNITRNQTLYNTVGLTVDSVHSMNEKLNTRVEICFKIKQLSVFKLCLVYITIPFNIQERLKCW